MRRCENSLKTAQRGWWMTQMMVSPVSLSRPRHLASETVAAPSRPDVGSSMKMIDGIATSSMPMLTRFFWPPEMPRFSSVPTIEF
mmetsp:Transcript_3815/g.10031  ORF Transcript_3815/g.10031 Transcript_3815/m.10031 type:complete len:85 (+) Transcript_3815:1992-2246(+)